MLWVVHHCWWGFTRELLGARNVKTQIEIAIRSGLFQSIQYGITWGLVRENEILWHKWSYLAAEVCFLEGQGAMCRGVWGQILTNPCWIWGSTGYSIRTLAFLLHINDLPAVGSSQVLLFTDNRLMCRPKCTWDDQVSFQQDLLALEQWGHTMGMRFNARKCYIYI